MVDKLMLEAENKKTLTINLSDQLIIDENQNLINFNIDPFRKKCLLEGLDDIAITLTKNDKIKSFESTLLDPFFSWIPGFFWLSIKTLAFIFLFLWVLEWHSHI